MSGQQSIGLGVSGSIAAYKAIYLTRLLTEHYSVTPMLTRGALRFVGELSFSALCGRRAITDLWSAASAGEIGHVEVAHKIDALVIAPCTADLIARLAAGRANEPLTAVALATRAPILIVPAMETGMWENAATQQNLRSLVARGVVVLDPTPGELASGRTGLGRMAEPEVIAEATHALLAPRDLAGRKVLVTAGPTREQFDPVRFISNPSSGTMGFAIAQIAKRRGASVTLVCGPVSLPHPTGVAVVPVTTTEEMLAACEARVDAADVLVMAAAPADYRPTTFSPEKIKKTGPGDGLDATVEQTPDILTSLRAHERGCFVVGFAAESHNVLEYARQKRVAKNMHVVVANDITRPDAGFGAVTNAVTVIGADTEESLPVMAKLEVAVQLWDRVVPALKNP